MVLQNYLIQGRGAIVWNDTNKEAYFDSSLDFNWCTLILKNKNLLLEIIKIQILFVAKATFTVVSTKIMIFY